MAARAEFQIRKRSAISPVFVRSCGAASWPRRLEVMRMTKQAACVLGQVVVAGLVGSIGATAQTLKERLSDKASDEQRVDNCRVPPERRGTTPRPDCEALSRSRDAAKPSGQK
jgi:hypothetical protein